MSSCFQNNETATPSMEKHNMNFSSDDYDFSELLELKTSSTTLNAFIFSDKHKKKAKMKPKPLLVIKTFPF